jgi:hypothetical protein
MMKGTDRCKAACVDVLGVVDVNNKKFRVRGLNPAHQSESLIS